MKYWRTWVKVEVLSAGEHPPVFRSLYEVNYAITNGSCSGDFEMMAEELTEAEMSERLTAQGSDPSFLIEEEE